MTQDRRRIGWRFVLTPRWFGYAAFAIAFAVACAFLSEWQGSRSAWAAAKNAQTAKNFYAEPMAVTEALPALDAWSPERTWLRVHAVGSFEPASELFVRNRPLNGSPGFEVLTPLRLADGSAIIVNRGWVETGANVNEPAEAVPAPSGEVTVILRLKPSEPRFGTTPDIEDQVQTVELEQVARRVDGLVYTGAYGLLDRYVSANSPGLLTPIQTTLPLENQGMYLSYMIQWIVFALIGFFALGHGIRNEFRRLNEGDERQRLRHAKRELIRARRPPGDAQEEDALLDAAGA